MDISAPDVEPPFASIAIVGLGLIGGSIALALRERWPAVRLVGVDRPPVLAHVQGSGVLQRTAGSVAELPDVELVILAAPVGQNLALLQEVAARRLPGVVITDVGGTKRAIVAAAQALPGDQLFVGGHPIGGAERGGFAFARPDLLRGRPWIFTPDAAAPADALARLFALARGVGAVPSTLPPEEHDRLMAFVSHLPQLAASALMEVAGGAVAGSGLRLAGRGLADTTRLASSPADVWRDICASNADAIGEALDQLIERLSALRHGLRQGEAVDRTFAAAARWRAEMMK